MFFFFLLAFVYQSLMTLGIFLSVGVRHDFHFSSPHLPFIETFRQDVAPTTFVLEFLFPLVWFCAD